MELSRRTAHVLLAVLIALFVVRLGCKVGVTLQAIDEVNCCASAARLVDAGGPLYGNVVTHYGPVVYCFTEAVFRLCGLYNVPAVRMAEVLWWAATALVVYAAARTLMGRLGALGAAAAFLLTALNPGFHQIRGEPLAVLPLAASVGLCVAGVVRRSAALLLLAGGAVGMVILTKQQGGLALPAIAAGPLLAWWWGGRRERLWLAACGSALVVGGCVAAVGGVWLYYALRGAGHAFFYSLYTYNASFMQACPAGGFLPSFAYLWERVGRFTADEALMPLALVGAVVGFLRPGVEEAAPQPFPRRAAMAMLALLLGAMWLAASPADMPTIPAGKYVHYKSLLYAPMCLLAGVCLEVAGRLQGRRRLLVAAALAMAVVYVLVPASQGRAPVVSEAVFYARMYGPWHILIIVGAMAAAGWLFGGRWVACLAPLMWAVACLAAPRSLSPDGAHAATAVGLVALGILRHAGERRSVILAALAGLAHAAAFRVDWSPQLGLVAGGAVWLVLRPGLSRAERWVLPALYLAAAVPVGLAMSLIRFEGTVGEKLCLSDIEQWWATVEGWLWASRLGLTLAVCGVLVLAWGAPSVRRAWGEVGRHGLGLLLLSATGALAGGLAWGLGPAFSAHAGMALVLAAALVVGLLIRREGPAPEVRGALLLRGGCVAAGMVALTLALRSPIGFAPERHVAELSAAIPPGSRAYVWGLLFDMEVYLRARAIPAVPQLGTWMLEGVGLPAQGRGLLGYPEVVRLASLDRALASALPPYVVEFDRIGLPLRDFPLFGPMLRERYRVVVSLPQSRLYRLAMP